MAKIEVTPLPDGAFLKRYKDQKAYTDCFSVEVPSAVSLSQFIEAFYTTPLFKLERLILILVRKPSTDAEARLLAKGESDQFAAWTVEARADDQIMLCDFMQKTRSWLMCAPAADGVTRLYFGSGVVPIRLSANGGMSFGEGFRLLIGFHRLYARALLWSAVQRVRKGKIDPQMTQINTDR